MTALILLKDFLETQIEIWRPIENLPQGFEVSNLGKIRNWREKYKYTGKMGWGWRVGSKPHDVTICPDKDGYLKFLFDSKLRKKLGYSPFVHQIVARHFVSGFLDGLQVNHRNLIKQDNRSTNLEWVTQDVNRRHAVDNGAHARGERIHLAKLTAESVQQIRALRASGIGTKELCARFGVERSSIKRVLNRKTWKHV